MAKPEEQVKAAFMLIAEARREMTLWHFQQFVQDSLAELGSAGFVESIGRAIVAAVEAENGTALPSRPADLDLTAVEINAALPAPRT